MSAERAGEVAGVAGGKTDAEEAETPDAPAKKKLHLQQNKTSERQLKLCGNLGPQEEAGGGSNQVLGQREGWYLLEPVDRSWGEFPK